MLYAAALAHVDFKMQWREAWLDVRTQQQLRPRLERA